jgi:hypothetical protein
MSSVGNTMETTDQKNSLQRRSFFLQVLGTVVGTGVLGNYIQTKLKTQNYFKNDVSLQVKIHPQAVSRTKKDYEPLG